MSLWPQDLSDTIVTEVSMVGKLFIKCLWQATKKALVQSYRILLALATENHTIFKNSSCHVSEPW